MARLHPCVSGALTFPMPWSKHLAEKFHAASCPSLGDMQDGGMHVTDVYQSQYTGALILKEAEAQP